MSNYYVSKNGQNTGPFEESEVRRQLQTGELSASDMVCQEGWNQWEPSGKIFPQVNSTPAMPSGPLPARAKAKGSGAVFSAWMCFGIALVLMVIPFPTFYLYGPLLLVAFILSIVVLSQGRTGAGLAILMSTILIPPVVFVAFWVFGLVGMGALSSTMAKAQRQARGETNIVALAKPEATYQTNLVIYELSSKKVKDLLDGEVTGVFGKIKNNGDRTLSRLKITAYFTDSSGKTIFEESFFPISTYNSKDLKAGYIESFGFKAKGVPSEWSGDFTVKVTDLSFAPVEKVSAK